MRTVFSVDTLGGLDATGAPILMVKAERAAQLVPAAQQYRPFMLSAQSLPAWGTVNAVRERGRLLRQELRKHPGLSTILDNLAGTPPGRIAPLYLKLPEGEPEQINWETLCDQNDAFLALDQRWPIGRISDPMSFESRPPPVLATPVKVLAVISAFGIAGQEKEWKMLRDAAKAARGAGLPVRMRVLAGDDATRGAVQADIDAGLGWVELAHVENPGTRVIQDIGAWKPNIVHFFCHGRGAATPGDQGIELATASDYLGAGAGSVSIRAPQLAGLAAALDNPWLLTLNCCSGAEATKELQSIACRAVSAGFPAAVAMTEPIAAADAHEFTRAFYFRLFDELGKAAAALAQHAQVPFEWVHALHDARAAICALHDDDAPNAREWVLPVIYVRGVDPLPFQRAAAAVSEEQAADFKLRARVVAGWLQAVRGEATEAQRRAVMEKALADVPKAYWPTVDGGFAHG